MQDTRVRLVEAGRRLFAERGFRNATVREIAARAGCNLASINYYFRSKEALYQEVLRETFAGGTPQLASPGERDSPHQRLKCFIERIFSSLDVAAQADRARLLAWETLSPTGFLDTTSATELESYLPEATLVIKAFCGSDCEPEILSTAPQWLLGQCLAFRSSFTADPHADSRIAERLIHLALEALCMETSTRTPVSHVFEAERCANSL